MTRGKAYAGMKVHTNEARTSPLRTTRKNGTRREPADISHGHGQRFSEIVFRNRVIAELNGVEVLVRVKL